MLLFPIAILELLFTISTCLPRRKFNSVCIRLPILTYFPSIYRFDKLGNRDDGSIYGLSWVQHK